ncbi:DUF3040 domain-containing protein [Actinoplanes sp. NPDC051861]|uniref:DUF3040 domain-containing protein n=1 Tax=Actinoplanes sp. NPDC051861 TaxID=3155170 RepID=UPI0034439FF2
MLDERDRRALEDIEQRLCSDDPEFARRMSATTIPCRFPVVPALCVMLFLALPFVALFLGPRVALVLADIIAVTVVVLLAYRSLGTRGTR